MAPSAATQHNHDLIERPAVADRVRGRGLLGVSAGTYVAAGLALPSVYGGIVEIISGRLQPVHATLVIFDLGGTALLAASYYVVQRIGPARLAGHRMANPAFWGWQLSLLAGVIGCIKGITEGRECVEFSWYVDNMITAPRES